MDKKMNSHVEKSADRVKEYREPTLCWGKDVFVSFYAFDPSAGRLRRKRIKLNRELAKISGKRAKKEYAEGVCSRLREELSGGFNPWIDQSKNLVYSRFDDVCDQYKVLVMAESTEGDNPKKGQKPKKVGHIKMVVIPDSKKETIDPIASNGIWGCQGSERRYEIARQLSKDVQRICREKN